MSLSSQLGLTCPRNYLPGGLRGGLSIALALSVPDLQSRTWILATTYLVVVFSIVLQGGTLDLFLKRIGRFD
jgi:monovalent cation:H+ antiporter, CPA1 family